MDCTEKSGALKLRPKLRVEWQNALHSRSKKLAPEDASWPPRREVGGPSSPKVGQGNLEATVPHLVQSSWGRGGADRESSKTLLKKDNTQHPPKELKVGEQDAYLAQVAA